MYSPVNLATVLLSTRTRTLSGTNGYIRWCPFVPLIVGVMVSVMSLSILASCFVTWRKRPKLFGWLLSRNNEQPPYFLKPELHAEEVASLSSMIKNPRWHEMSSDVLRNNLDNGVQDRFSAKSKHAFSISVPRQELRGVQTGCEMPA